MQGRRWQLWFVTWLTFGRFPFVLLFFIAALLHSWRPHPGWFLTAFLSLVIAALSDIFDGYYARKFQVVTPFGAHADPLMDKAFYLMSMPTLTYLAQRHGQPMHALWLLVMTVFILARDQWVTFLRSIGSIYNVTGAASWSGKLRTAFNFPMICGIYFFLASGRNWIPAWLVYPVEVIAFGINFLSMYIYTRRYWDCLAALATGRTPKQD